MKRLIIVLLLGGLFACAAKRTNEVLDRKQLTQVLEESILLSGITSDQILLYQEYDNHFNVDSIIAFYQYGSNIFGYKVNDSVINSLADRKNGFFPNNINELSALDIKLVSDTINIEKSYILISEPFFIDSNLMLFTMSNRDRVSNENWIFFLEKKEDTFKIISYYDFQKDRLYQRENL